MCYPYITFKKVVKREKKRDLILEMKLNYISAQRIERTRFHLNQVAKTTRYCTSNAQREAEALRYCSTTKHIPLLSDAKPVPDKKLTEAQKMRQEPVQLERSAQPGFIASIKSSFPKLPYRGVDLESYGKSRRRGCTSFS